ENLTIYPENMRRNIDATHGVIFSQRVLLALIDQGMVREEAYSIVQPKAMEAWQRQVSFKSLIEQDERITEKLTQREIDDCFDHTDHLKNVDAVFHRIGLEECIQRSLNHKRGSIYLRYTIEPERIEHQKMHRNMGISDGEYERIKHI